MSNNETNTEIYINPLAPQKENYMITPLLASNTQVTGVQPMSSESMNQFVTVMGLEVVRRIKPSTEIMATMGINSNTATDTIVTKIEPDRAELIRQSLPPNLIITKDKTLDYGDPLKSELTHLTPFYSTEEVVSRKFNFRVIGQNEKPLEKITVELVGDGYPVQGITNDNGEIELEIKTLGINPPRLLQVMAQNSYWDIYLSNPQIEENKINVIQMHSFIENPQQTQLGWGETLIGLDKLPKEINGAGVKIAIIDSGCDNNHFLLRHIQHGRDFTKDRNQSNWNQDTVGHGTHCAGIIAARSEGNNSMRGFAPESEIHILRVFPGGEYSSLIEALYYCIEQKIDVVNMSLGGDSQIDLGVEQALGLAVQNGIACIVAAGNSGDAVKYPASSPKTFAVAAVGDIKKLQPNTWECTTVQEGLVTTDGIFSPKFTCFGPEIAVCAPGVEIISTVPGGTFEAMSGTSMAAPHITGIAALLLAHHPLFRDQFKQRNVERVSALFNMIRSLCTPYPFGNTRAGAGLPKLDQIISALQRMTYSSTGTEISHTPGVSPAAIGNMMRPFAAAPQLLPQDRINTPVTIPYRFY